MMFDDHYLNWSISAASASREQIKIFSCWVKGPRAIFTHHISPAPHGPQTKNKTALYSFHIAFFSSSRFVLRVRLTKKIQLRNHLIIWTKKGETSTHFSAICNFFLLRFRVFERQKRHLIKWSIASLSQPLSRWITWWWNYCARCSIDKLFFLFFFIANMWFRVEMDNSSIDGRWLWCECREQLISI